MSLNLNIETLIFTIVLGHLFSGILGIAYMIRHKKDTYLYSFFFARLFETLGWTLLWLRGTIDTSVSISVGNSFLIIAQALQIIAFLNIKDRCNKFIKRVYFSAAAFFIVIFHLALLLHNVDGVRVSIMSIGMAVFWYFPIYVLITDKDSSVLQKTVALVYMVEIVLLILRACLGIRLGKSMYLMSNNIYNVLFFICLYLIMLMGNIGFILMSKEKSDSELIKVATHDELTEIFNRRAFLMRAKENISLFSRRKEPISFFLIDLDNFKKINDDYGHFVGDMILKDFALIIKMQLRDYDLFGRFGGEEFTVLLPGANEKTALEVAERLRRVTENTSVSIDMNLSIKYTISIGIVTVIPDESTSIDTLYKLSDDALYKAKGKGRNRIEIAKITEMDMP
ncbi:GGDEF domain-containing protein [Anaerocolumna sp.]|uniref:GGDEF domain-containing protein n=1 Tax=Anaerocolumna sp. TaxID=2041569 RepID=UPI0028B02C74|nr:GGDEF domain-containing protein [Anaerocolumna sp.]